MSLLEIEKLRLSIGNFEVLKGVDLTIADGEIVCLLGASGSGKTTLLRIIAGLEYADAGSVKLDGASILSIPVHQRDFSFMFQDFALFPHLNVVQNVVFGLRMRKVNRAAQQKRVAEVLDLVGLSGFEQRDVTELSGGERQRVALARSLAPSPRLLLLDEPLGSLDASLRERLAVELREIIRQTGLTAVHVTHDQQEAYAIADRIAIMSSGPGRIVTNYSVSDLVARPRNSGDFKLWEASQAAVRAMRGGEVNVHDNLDAADG